MKRLFLLTIALCAGCALALGQGRTVKGVVTSADDGGQPLASVIVYVRGTTGTGQITDADGHYSIAVPGADAVLVFKYTGYETQEVPVQGRAVVNVVMKPALEEIDQVVVTGYGTVKKQSLVGAQASVGSKELERRPVTNITQALAASAPGVQVTTASGQPGSGSSVRIRGFGSVNASSAPMYVVDGAVYNGSVADIPANDIESISLLKDASATAIYGSSAGNGVILITTKSGSSKTRGGNFTFTTSQGISMRGQQPYETVGPMEIYPLRWQQWYNDNRYSLNMEEEESALLANISVIDALDLNYLPFAGDLDVMSIDSKGKNPKMGAGHTNYPLVVTPEGKLSEKVTGLLWGDDLDWESLLFRMGYRQEYTLSGGYTADRFRSYMSVGYLNEQGYRIRTNFQRYTARLNSSYDVNKWFTTGLNLAYTRSMRESPRTTGSANANNFLWMQSIAPIYPIHKHNADGSYVIREGKKVYDASEGRPYTPGYNPVWEALLDLSTSERDAVTTRAFGEVHIIPGLNFKVNAAYDLYKSTSVLRYNNTVGDQRKAKGYLDKSAFRDGTLTVNELLEYRRTFNKLHELSALVGHENYLYMASSLSGSKKTTFVHGMDEFSAYTTINDLKSGSSEYRKESYLGRVNYDYSNLYNVSVSFRRDGSSRFAPKKRWGNFWSLGAGWHIGNEKFMQSTKQWLSELKLRLSIGQTGNDNIGTYYAYQTTFRPGSNNLDNIGLRFASLGNPELLWETQTSYDVAIDFGLFYRITGTVEFFVKESSNLIFNYKLPASTGIPSMDKNIGKVRNYGVEFNLNADAIRTPEWRWSLNVNGTWFRNVVVRLPEENRKEGIETGIFKYMEGYSIYNFNLKHFVKVDPNNGRAVYRIDPQYTPLSIDPTGPDSIYTYNDDHAERLFTGESSIPLLYGGFGTSLSWRSLELSMQFAYQIGGKAYDSDYQSLMHRDLKGGTSAHVDLKKAWRHPDHKTNVPALYAGENGKSNNAQSDRFLIDASALMMKNIALTYTLPKKWLAFTQGAVQNVRIGVMGENLFLLSRRTGLNPMSSFNGMNSSTSFSFARTFTGTISITF